MALEYLLVVRHRDRGSNVKFGWFYGWTVVASAFSVFMIAYSFHFGFGVFVPHLSAELGLDRAAVTAPYSIYVAIYSLLSLATGTLTDRIGPRRVVWGGGLLLCLAFAGLSRATTEWELYLYLCGFAGLAMSAAYVPLNATVVKWFVKRRGLALAIAGSGTSAAMLVGPLLAAGAVAWLGWRDGMLALSLVTGALIFACATALVRDPEMVNLVPDGRPIGGDTDANGSPPVEEHWTLKEARSTAAFWLILSAFFMSWAAIFFPAIHIPSMMTDRGHDAVTAASITGTIGLTGLAGRWFIGLLSDRIGRVFSLSLCLLTQVVGYFAFAAASSVPVYYAAAGLIGLGIGSSVTIFPALLGDIFGRLHVGAIAGFVFGIAGSAAAIGPYAGGLIREQTGDYAMAFAAGGAVNVAALALILLLRTPQKRPAARPASTG